MCVQKVQMQTVYNKNNVLQMSCPIMRTPTSHNKVNITVLKVQSSILCKIHEIGTLLLCSGVRRS